FALLVVLVVAVAAVLGNPAPLKGKKGGFGFRGSRFPVFRPVHVVPFPVYPIGGFGHGRRW
ncbi:hypothetical protein Pcinc_026146, partial [Petrolisthes cinctipes]